MINLSISPANNALVIKPGATASQTLLITNLSENELYLTPSIESWQPSDGDGSVIFDTKLNPDISFKITNHGYKIGQTFSLKPKQALSLDLAITPKENISSFDSYYSFFVSQNSDNSLLSAPQTITRLGSNILITISDTINLPKKASITEFKSNPPRLVDSFFSPITLTAQVKNDTAFYSLISGKIVIKKNKKDLQEININPKNTLSLNKRNLDPITLKPPFWPGFYEFKLELNSQFQSTPVSINLFVFPFYLTIAISILLAIFFLSKALSKRH